MKVLFELPIYPTEQAEYDRKWETKFKIELDAITEECRKGFLTIEQANKRKNRTIERIEKEKSGWKYNQIIGYLIISFDDTINNIIFDVCISDGKHRFDASRKKKMKHWGLLGEHFKVDKRTSNEEIIEQIREHIIGIMNLSTLKNRYIDMESFDNIIDYINVYNACMK